MKHPDPTRAAQAPLPMRHVLRMVPAYSFETNIGTSSDLATIFYDDFMDNYQVVPYYTSVYGRQPDYYVCYNDVEDAPPPTWLDTRLRKIEGFEDYGYDDDTDDYWELHAPDTVGEAIERLIDAVRSRRIDVDALPYTITVTGYCQGDYARVLWLTTDNLAIDQTGRRGEHPEWLANEVCHILWDSPISGELTISDADGEEVCIIDAADLSSDGYDWDKDYALAAIARLTEGEEYAPHLLAWAEQNLPANHSLPHWD